jgi:hypothetical protein
LVPVTLSRKRNIEFIRAVVKRMSGVLNPFVKVQWLEKKKMDW